MADGFVRLPADSTGKVLGTDEFTYTASPSGTAHAQRLILCDKNGRTITRAYGPLRVSMEDKSLFYDPFEGVSIDTTHRWVTPTGANAPTQASSMLSFPGNVTASAFGKLTSQPSFNAIIPGFLQVSNAMAFADAAATYRTGGHRFWGIGTSPATPATTAGNSITNGIGFEIDTDGKMKACVYNAGTRIFVADLSSTGTGDAQNTQPTTTAQQRYIVQIRTDRIFWFIENLDKPIATATFQVPATQVMPVLIQAINPASPVAGGYPISVQGSVVADTAGHHSFISDGTYAWRKATVSSGGGLNVQQAPASTSAVTQVTSSATNVTLKAANTARRGLTIFNDSVAVLYVKLGATASTTSYTVKVASQGYYEVPSDYSGIVDGIWTAANGFAYITEVT